MIKWLIAILVCIMMLGLGYTFGRTSVAIDCLELRLTVINGQTYACKPHVTSPKRVM